MSATTENPNPLMGHLQQGTFFEGKLTFVGVLKIGGHFKGEIVSDGLLVIDETAVVEGEISVREATIKGQFFGQLKAEKRVTMLSPAKFKGTVSAPNLKIEEGVLFDGSSSTNFKLDPRASN